MFKAIIVDDELYIRKGLRMLIDWEKEGILITGEASNGKQAVSLVKEQRPDIVITDIKMPVMDGLDFIEYIRKEMSSNIQIIVLSGYADFKFAQKAMQYGVKKYVLKPIDEKELLDALNDVKKNIEAEEIVEYGTQISKQSRKSALIKGILLGKSSISIDNIDNSFFNVKKSNKYFCIIFHIKKKWYSSRTGSYKNGTGQKSEIDILTNIINGNEFSDFIELFEYDYLWGFFVDYERMLAKGFTLNQFLFKLGESVKAEYSTYVTIFAGKVIENFPNNIKSAFETAYETMKLGFYNYDKYLYQYADFKDTPMVEDYNEEIFTDDLIEKIINSDVSCIKAKLDAIFGYLGEKKLDPEVIKIRLNYLVHKMVEAIAGIDGNYDRNPEKYPVYNMNYWEINVDELKEMVLAFCTNTALYIHDLKENIGNGIAYKVKKYIDMNFAQDITLTKLAQDFFVNTNYLGQIFKKIYYMKFNDYLNHVRVEEAKKLLQLTGLKAYEVSTKVGYTKPEYFSRKFEEITGLCPSVYREEHSK